MEPPGQHLSLEEILAEASRLDLDLSERTFRYYSVLGLLPSAVKLPCADARVHYYPRAIIDRLQQIRWLQGQGYSLKQIKRYFQAQPAVENPAGQQPASSPAASARILLEAFASGLPQQAEQRFRARSKGADDEDFQAAAVDYFADLLSCCTDAATARTAVMEAIAGLPPLEMEQALLPLRRWRRQEPARHASSGLPVVDRLRHLALQKLAGHDPPADERQGYARELLALARQARPQEQDTDPLVGRAAVRIRSALERLASLSPVDDPATTLQELAEVEAVLAGTDQLLRLYRELILQA